MFPSRMFRKRSKSNAELIQARASELKPKASGKLKEAASDAEKKLTDTAVKFVTSKVEHAMLGTGMGGIFSYCVQGALSLGFAFFRECLIDCFNNRSLTPLKEQGKAHPVGAHAVAAAVGFILILSLVQCIFWPFSLTGDPAVDGIVRFITNRNLASKGVPTFNKILRSVTSNIPGLKMLPDSVFESGIKSVPLIAFTSRVAERFPQLEPYLPKRSSEADGQLRGRQTSSSASGLLTAKQRQRSLSRNKKIARAKSSGGARGRSRSSTPRSELGSSDSESEERLRAPDEGAAKGDKRKLLFLLGAAFLSGAQQLFTAFFFPIVYLALQKLVWKDTDVRYGLMTVFKNGIQLNSIKTWAVLLIFAQVPFFLALPPPSRPSVGDKTKKTFVKSPSFRRKFATCLHTQLVLFLLWNQLSKFAPQATKVQL